jgi:hypothetical protein
MYDRFECRPRRMGSHLLAALTDTAQAHLHLSSLVRPRSSLSFQRACLYDHLHTRWFAKAPSRNAMGLSPLWRMYRDVLRGNTR